MRTISLDGTWSVREEELSCKGEESLLKIGQALSGWLPAKIPGEIHLDLFRAGLLPDPSVSTHMPQCRWPETKSWWYRTSFTVDTDFLLFERQELVFDGLDLYAQVFVNGKLAGEAANAFIPASFDVRGLLQAGENELIVRLTAGSELAQDESATGQDKVSKPNKAASGAIPNPVVEGDLYGHRNWAGRKWLRKPQFSYGWDWVDALPNIGIWRGVHLEGRSHAVLHDLRLDTRFQDTRVFLEMAAVVENIHSCSERVCLLELEIQPPEGGPCIQRHYTVDALPGRNTVQDAIEIPQAKLWYPNGMGEQPLYRVVAKITNKDGIPCDQRQFSIGLRTIDIDRTHLAEGSRFCIRVNGQEVFCRGANIGPHDAILARISDAKYEALVAEAKNAQMNMIRINGCSIYEPPVFYEACDRAGILVWQDFMFTCGDYPDDDPVFYSMVRNEIEKIILILRHHPSLAIWCGNNEINWLVPDWNKDPSRLLTIHGWKFYSLLFPDLCRFLDPNRPYWISSPAGGKNPNSELEGDCHWWSPFFMNPDISRRIRHEVFDECRARFVSEYGVIGPCHLDSIKEYLSPEEIQPGSKAWQVHTNTFEKETVPAAIRLHYTDPENLTVPEYVLYGQMFQAIIHGHAMEALRFRKQDPVDDCQGALIWSYSDCWGETGWSILDYNLRRKVSYYWFRRACAPVKVIVRRRGENLVTRLINDTLQPFRGCVEYGWRRLDGSNQAVQTKQVDIAANRMQEIAVEPMTNERDASEWLYAAVLHPEQGRILDQSIWLMAPHRKLALPSPEIKVTLLANGWIEVFSPVYCHAVHIEDHGHEIISDNWFDLLPGVPKLVKWVEGVQPESIEFGAVIGKKQGP